MALTDLERLLLDVIAAWQKDNPDEYGPFFVDIEEELEARRVHSSETGHIGGLLQGLHDKGLLEPEPVSDWERLMVLPEDRVLRARWRTRLLDRLAHEADG